MAIDPKKDMADAYDKLVKSKREVDKATAENKKLEENKQLEAANAKNASAQAEKSQAASSVRKTKLDNVAANASEALWSEHKGLKKASMKAYESMASAMADISALSLLMSEAINAHVWAMLAGPYSNMAYDKLIVPVVGGLVGLPVDVVKGTLRGVAGVAGLAAEKIGEGIDNSLGTDLTGTKSSKVDLDPELMNLLPQNMIKVTDVGELQFEKFETKFQGELEAKFAGAKYLPQNTFYERFKAKFPNENQKGLDKNREVLRNLDDFYERATRILLNKEGYEYDGVHYEKDGEQLTQDKFNEIITAETNLEQLLGEAMKNHPAPAPALEDDESNDSGPPFSI
jgi:hypothetical protein